jgi:hypothetical protein
MRRVVGLPSCCLGAVLVVSIGSYASAHDWNVTSCERLSSRRAQHVIKTVCEFSTDMAYFERSGRIKLDVVQC